MRGLLVMAAVYALLMFVVYLVLRRIFSRCGKYLLLGISDVVAFLVVLAVALLDICTPGGDLNGMLGQTLLLVYGPVAAVILICIVVARWRSTKR